MILCQFEDGEKANLRHAVADALILKDGKILLVKRAPNLLAGGKWGIVGGYIDMDETLEECVRREVLEETGYEIKNLKLFSVADNPRTRNDPRFNIAFLFTCEALEQVGTPDNESSEQKWFDLNDLPKEMAFDHLNMIKVYLKNKDTSIKLIEI